ncbi:MAG: hypothetical protein Q8Q25_01505 [bacterium]|nr:hypothetical protein [bacterium]
MNEHHHHEHTITGELICHLPYAIFSVALGLGLLSLISIANMGQDQITKSSNILFHSFHFIHIVFAATGTLLTFLRFSRNTVKALIVGIFSPAIFCTLSDVVLPYLGGRVLGVNMHFHLCFYNELHNVVPFLFVGIFNGFVMSKHYQHRQGLYSLFSHAMHILVSSLASLFYLVSQGFTYWYTSIGVVFLFLVVAVVVPCSLSDVVVPMIFAKTDKKK